jgi:ubiquinone/menaquinone biosynthesis C-methylase UbiE
MSQLDSVQRSSQEQFDRQSDRYGKSHILADISDVAELLKHVPPTSRKLALDVATGGGHTGIYLAEQGWHVTLADISAAMLTRARTLAGERGLQVETRQHAAETFPYPDGAFDLVTCRVAPHHFSDPAAFVREAARVLVAGGSLAVIDSTVDDGQPEAEEWMHQVEKLRDPSHQRLITPNRWREMCNAAGLRLIHSEITRFLQPDLNWYFETAATPPANQEAILRLIDSAPKSARRLFDLNKTGDNTTWYWQRMSFVAIK